MARQSDAETRTAGENLPIDSGGLEQVYRDYSPKVFRTALRLTANRETALDILQEVFLRYIGAAETISSSRAVSSWLYRVTVNCAVDSIRSESKLAVITDATEGTEESSERFLLVSESRKVILLEIERLPLKQRLAVIMRFMLGDDLSTIARSLDLTYDSARVVLHRGLKKLRKRLAHKKGGLHVNV